MFKLNLIKNYWENDINLYKKSKVELHPGVTILVGCNGIGKTTFLTQLKEQLTAKGKKYKELNNLGATTRNRQKLALKAKTEDFEYLATSLMSSEGENIMLNVGFAAAEIGTFIRKNKGEEIFLLFDAVDSGLSIDGIIEVKDLFRLIMNDCGEDNVYIIVSTNAYEFAFNEHCLDVLRGEYVYFSDYMEYREFILETAKEKKKRYK